MGVKRSLVVASGVDVGGKPCLAVKPIISVRAEPRLRDPDAQAEVLALSVLKQVMEEKVTKTNVDIATVAPKYHLYTQDEVQGVIDRL